MPFLPCPSYRPAACARSRCRSACVTCCTAPDDSDYPASCITEIHAGTDLSVQIRFRKGMLANWDGIKSGVRVLLLSFGVTA